MQIDATQRQVTLSVGEFAAFKPYATPGFGGVSAVWRAQVGTQWHQRIQAESQAAGEGMRDEVPISGTLSWRGWDLKLTGRIDQFKDEGAATRLREIKTVNEPLPLARETILNRYLSYPVQLLAYRELLLRNTASALPASAATGQPLLPSEQFHLELLFVEIGSGLTQLLTLDASYDTLIVDQLDALVDYLEAKQERLANLRSLVVNPVYATPRPGQERIQEELADAFSRANLTLLEAPTGYGKTGVAWEYAARRLADGQADRALYLTSKSTGQTEAVERLRSLLDQAQRPDRPSSKTASAPATFWQIRNKQEHCIHTEFRCSRQTCPYLAELHDKWKRAGLQRLYLLSHDEVTLDNLKSEGRATGICPYEIMRAGLGYRDIWIGDYNYLFSSSSARLLEEQNDFDPSRTFLIIDEAHNLPSRVASAFTYEVTLHQAYAAADDLREARASTRIQNLLKGLASIIASLPAPRSRRAQDAEIPAYLEQDFSDHLAQLSDILTSEPLPYDELQPETGELLFNLAAARAGQKRGELRHLLWSPADGVARLECIDASRLIASQLSQYNGVLALSATLSPIDAYLEEIGLAPPSDSRDPRTASGGAEGTAERPIAHLRPAAPWREDAYEIAIDLRVDTRLKTREANMSVTARAIASAAESAAPAIVFFPSYAYAERALAVLQHEHPFVRATIQPRSGGTLAERAAYLEEALAFNDALFLILGSSYAEGVDTLGGKAGCAIIVSPALPEMNLIQEAKRKEYDNQSRNGFERAYLQPGIQKVNQALGRLVRSPQHKVKALLHCQRFADPKTKRLLDPLYQSKTYIQSDQDLQDWLNGDGQ